MMNFDEAAADIAERCLEVEAADATPGPEDLDAGSPVSVASLMPGNQLLILAALSRTKNRCGFKL